MRLLFIGDVVGRSGRTIVEERLPGLVADHAIDLVILNGENAAGGFGITEDIHTFFLNCGVDVVTTGNHVWDQREALEFCSRYDNFLRPANFPTGTPGRGSGLFAARNGARVMVMNVMGHLFMHPTLDDPFRTVNDALAACPLGEQADAIVIDFHAEATSEKVSMGHFTDSRVSLVVGTHTHVPTADHQILNGGTAYISDVGMTGDYDSSIGMGKEPPLQRFLTKLPGERMEAAQGPATLCGVAVEVDDDTGLANAIEPLRLGPRLTEHLPSFFAA
ncbi:MAG: TIGR00282 family metallophosphoesterase [Pseudomonadota bacterium]